MEWGELFTLYHLLVLIFSAVSNRICENAQRGQEDQKQVAREDGTSISTMSTSQSMTWRCWTLPLPLPLSFMSLRILLMYDSYYLQIANLEAHFPHRSLKICSLPWSHILLEHAFSLDSMWCDNGSYGFGQEKRHKCWIVGWILLLLWKTVAFYDSIRDGEDEYMRDSCFASSNWYAVLRQFLRQSRKWLWMESAIIWKSSVFIFIRSSSLCDFNLSTPMLTNNGGGKYKCEAL